MDFIFISTITGLVSVHVSSAVDCPAPHSHPSDGMERNYSTAYNLQACLLKDYDASVAPQYSSNVNDSEVQLWFGLKYLTMMNDKLIMFGDINLNWLDERLAFDSDWYDGEMSVSLPRYKVWKPTLVDKSRTNDFMFNTGYASLISNSGRSIDNVLVASSGHVDLHQVVSLMGKCDDVDYSFYPFDVHNCSAFISATDPNLQYIGLGYDYEDYRVYYDVLKEMTITVQTSSSGTLIQLNLEFRRHSRMHLIMLHVPVLAFLLFNFLSLWMSHIHLMKLVLPLTSFCGSLYQIHAINSLMQQSFAHSDVFIVSGSKPLHIILLYRNIIALSVMVLLQNFFSSLFGLSRKVLILFLAEYSETYARTLAPKDKHENFEQPKEKDDFSKSNIAPESPLTPAVSRDLSTEDYIVTMCDIVIVSFIAYNFGYLTFLVLHK